MTLRVSVFGGFTVTGRNGERYAFRGARQRALLAYLALSPAHEFSRLHLAELLWPDAPEDESRHSLRQCLSLLRRELGPDSGALTLDGDRVRLEADRFETDVALLHQLAASADPSDWNRVSDVYHGELLAGLELGGTPFDDWLALQRRITSEVAVATLARVAEVQTSAGDLSGAIVTVRRIVVLDPFDEVERRHLMRLLVSHGRSASAIREYCDFSTLLREHLAVEPSSETTHLYQSVIEGHRETPAYEAGMLQTYARALEQLPDCVVITDLATRIVGFSPVAEHQFGLRKAEVVGKTPAILHGRDLQTVFPLQFTHLALTHGRWTETVQLTTYDGGIHPMRRSVVTLRSPSGRAIGAFGMSVLSRS
jgi:PAS domain S-box-containing protein